MTFNAGLSPQSPNKYLGPNVALAVVVIRNRQPTGADYRQPETGKLYPLDTYWILGPNPVNGSQGELWYLSKIVANVAYWLMLSTGSSGPLLNVQVQTSTAPGVNPVTPTLAGLMTVNAAAVAAHSVPIETRTRALNEFNVEVQYGSTAVSTNALQSGLNHFNAAQFTVDANGFVSLIGGGASLDSLGVQATSGAGTNPVVGDGTGKIEMQGALVAAGTNPLRSVSTAANTLQYQVQTSQALIAPDSTKVGLANFSSVDFTVDANGFVQATNSGGTVGVRNIGYTYSAGTGLFSITAQDGSALSASNPGYVTIASKASPGTLVTVPVTANQTFIDDNGASTIVGNLFGLTSGRAYAQDIPFYVYAVLNDAGNAISFMISRYPNTPTSPVSGKIGKTGSAVANSQGSFFALSNPTVTNFDVNPALRVGGFRMRMSAANDWTVQTLSTVDGVGKFFQGYQFTLTTGQFGAAVGSFFKGSGPTFTNSSLVYWVTDSNQLMFTGFFENCTVNGGAGTLSIASPYLCTGGTTGCGRFDTTGANTFVSSVEGTTGDNSDTTFYYDNSIANSVLPNNAFTVAAASGIRWNVLVNISFV